MECPKCKSTMKELPIETLHGKVVIDQCSNCKGLWFDHGETERLKGDWMAEFADSGDPEVGRKYNQMRDVPCPRCSKTMAHLTVKDQPHIQYEACQDHGLYLDAGEFTDYKYETLMDQFRKLAVAIKGS